MCVCYLMMDWHLILGVSLLAGSVPRITSTSTTTLNMMNYCIIKLPKFFSHVYAGSGP